ncbi:hypothetical protein COLO4_08923 [Corchorus olitorius]|uniref:Uncharacterized protein n=1 Tax=Corchorus olitorius TaxID=93759 RepID=A0A1R3KE09_9ROSI|nr:hypothetical protein COLO4_08923 [Corchorus olitorius]
MEGLLDNGESRDGAKAGTPLLYHCFLSFFFSSKFPRPQKKVAVYGRVSRVAHKPLTVDKQQEVGRFDEEAEMDGTILIYLKDMGNFKNLTNNVKELVVMKLRNDVNEASLCKTSWVRTSTPPVAKDGSNVGALGHVPPLG